MYYLYVHGGSCQTVCLTILPTALSTHLVLSGRQQSIYTGQLLKMESLLAYKQEVNMRIK